jgi:hypothetical protein
MVIISKNKEKNCEIFHGIMPLDGAIPSVGPLGTTLGEAYFGNGLIPKHHPTLDDQLLQKGRVKTTTRLL